VVENKVYGQKHTPPIAACFAYGFT